MTKRTTADRLRRDYVLELDCIDEAQYVVRGHVSQAEYERAVDEAFGGRKFGPVRHVRYRGMPCHCGDHDVDYKEEPAGSRRRGAFDATIAEDVKEP